MLAFLRIGEASVVHADLMVRGNDEIERPGRIGIIGCGSMGGAIASGLLDARAVEPSRLLISDHNQEKLESHKVRGAQVFTNTNAMLAEHPDIIVLAIKPQVFEDALKNMTKSAFEHTLVISLLAGTPLEQLKALLPESARIMRAMPNIGVSIRQGATVIACDASARPEDAAQALALFRSLGYAALLTEEQLDVAGAISGSGPCYFALAIDALTNAGVTKGLKADIARSLALHTMAGTADLLIEGGEHPRQFMENVQSPGGTTIAGINYGGSLVYDGLQGCVEGALIRTEELANNSSAE